MKKKAIKTMIRLLIKKKNSDSFNGEGFRVIQAGRLSFQLVSNLSAYINSCDMFDVEVFEFIIGGFYLCVTTELLSTINNTFLQSVFN